MTKKENNNNETNNNVKQMRNRRVWGVGFIGAAVFFFIAIVSYCFHWKSDQDILMSGFLSLFENGDKIQNKMGVIGALTTHIFVTNGFGLPSFLLSFIIFSIGLNLTFNRIIFRYKILTYSLILTVYLSICFSFLFYNSTFYSGGHIGKFFASICIEYMGNIGTFLMLLVIVPFIIIIWIFNPQIDLKQNTIDTFINIVTFKWIKNIIKYFKPDANDDLSIDTNPIDKNLIQEQEANELVELNSIDTLNTNNSSIEDATHITHTNVLLGDNKFTMPIIQDNNQNIKFELIERTPHIEPQTTHHLYKEKELPENLPYQSINEKLNLITPLVVNHNKEDNETIMPNEQEKLIINNDLSQLGIASNLPNDNDLPSAENNISPIENVVLQQIKANDDITFILNPNQMVNHQIIIPGQDNNNLLNQNHFNTIENTLKTNKEEIELSQEPYDPHLDLSNFKMPPLDLLETYSNERVVMDTVELEKNKDQIIATLKNYDIAIQKIMATVGPTVTLYEIIPAAGVRISKIKNLEDDIALSLAALGIRIIAPIPGKGTIGIEVPNLKKSIVSMKTLLSSEKFKNSTMQLPIALGKKIDNENFIVDLTSMPHLLMAGATGQGKSVGINTILVSLLYKKHPSELKLVMIDPKKVELSIYKLIEKHYLAKLPNEEEAIITDTKKVIHTLNALCIEMDNRYNLLKEAGTRNLKEYNQKFISRKLLPTKGHMYLPFIVLVIDEFADLIMTAGKEVETPIARLAQLARAVGIHLIIATQRPSVNIITGTIKANFPARIAFKVSSKIDSRTILDVGGAEQLIGKGDMLISYNGEVTRLQCAFVDTPEVDRINNFISEQQGFLDAFLLPEYIDEKEKESRLESIDLDDRDVLFEEIARFIIQKQIGSTSLVQRFFKLGFNRAGRVMDQLENFGIVGPAQGSKPREVKIKTEAELDNLLNTLS